MRNKQINEQITLDFNLGAVERLLSSLMKGEVTLNQAVLEIGKLHEYTIRAQCHDEVKTSQSLFLDAIQTQHEDMMMLVEATKLSGTARK